MDALVPKTSINSSLTKKLAVAHQEIVTAAEAGKGDLTKIELKNLIVRVVAMHGIKELPSKEIMALCFDSWETRFSHRMNKQELFLAFEMNVNGDFEFQANGQTVHRVNHYNNFSREFFCDVLIQYLSEKNAAQKKLAELSRLDERVQAVAAAPDVTVSVLEAIMADFRTFHAQGLPYSSPANQFATNMLFPTNVKLEMINEIMEVELTEKRIDALRQLATRALIRSLTRQRSEVPKDKMGIALEITHKLARVKSGKMITEKDEELLQTIVKQLLYMQVLDSWKPKGEETLESCEFIQHIQENISLYNKTKIK